MYERQTQEQFGRIAQSPAGQYNFLQGGNSNLVPEEADTWPVGAVLSPGGIDGLTVTVDYYNIEIEQGISELTPEFILNERLDGNLAMCENVRRDRRHAGSGRDQQRL